MADYYEEAKATSWAVKNKLLKLRHHITAKKCIQLTVKRTEYYDI
jgi:hypothetical protein